MSGELNVQINEGPCSRVSAKALVRALNVVKATKAAGSRGTRSELLKVFKNDSVKKLA